MPDNSLGPPPTAFERRRIGLTVVVPAYNEAEALLAVDARLRAALDATDVSWELLYVDDGSTDDTPRLLAEIQSTHTGTSVLRLSRNFGKEAAMACGLHHARGEAVVIIDADLQDPPELIPSMMEAWRAGADVVNMRRRVRHGESWLKKATAHAFYRVINRLSDVPIPEDVGDFRLLSRRALDALERMPERGRFMKGLFAWVGFAQVTLEYDREPRAAGTTKWRYRALWNFAIEGITGFSMVPLKLATVAGLASALCAFVYAAFVIVRTLLFGEPVQGFPTLIVVTLMLGGLQLMAIGVLGEYLGRLFIESKQRPLYLIDAYRPAVWVAGRARDRRAA